MAFSAARHSVQHGRFLAIGRSNEAGYLARLGFVDAAIAARRRVAEVWLRLAQDNPALPGLRAEASAAYRDLASMQRQFGRETEAAETVLASRQLIENLPQETAEDVYNLSVIYATLARNATGADAPVVSPADADLREALQTLARAVALGFRNRDTIEKEAAFAPTQGPPRVRIASHAVGAPPADRRSRQRQRYEQALGDAARCATNCGSCPATRRRCCCWPKHIAP